MGHHLKPPLDILTPPETPEFAAVVKRTKLTTGTENDADTNNGHGEPEVKIVDADGDAETDNLTKAVYSLDFSKETVDGVGYTLIPLDGYGMETKKSYEKKIGLPEEIQKARKEKDEEGKSESYNALVDRLSTALDPPREKNAWRTKKKEAAGVHTATTADAIAVATTTVAPQTKHATNGIHVEPTTTTTTTVATPATPESENTRLTTIFTAMRDLHASLASEARSAASRLSAVASDCDAFAQHLETTGEAVGSRVTQAGLLRFFAKQHVEFAQEVTSRGDKYEVDAGQMSKFLDGFEGLEKKEDFGGMEVGSYDWA